MAPEHHRGAVSVQHICPSTSWLCRAYPALLPMALVDQDGSLTPQTASLQPTGGH